MPVILLSSTAHAQISQLIWSTLSLKNKTGNKSSHGFWVIAQPWMVIESFEKQKSWCLYSFSQVFYPSHILSHLVLPCSIILCQLNEKIPPSQRLDTKRSQKCNIYIFLWHERASLIIFWKIEWIANKEQLLSIHILSPQLNRILQEWWLCFQFLFYPSFHTHRRVSTLGLYIKEVNCETQLTFKNKQKICFVTLSQGEYCLLRLHTIGNMENVDILL